MVGILAMLALATNPQTAQITAATDVVKLDVETRKYTVYLSEYAIPKDQREEFRNVLAFHVNSLSKKAKLTKPRVVSDDMLAIDLRWYGWDKKTWDKLADIDPYFHALIKTKKKVTAYWPGGKWTDGKEYAAGNYDEEKEVIESAQAPWLDSKLSISLVELTQSKAPIIRADWFLVQTAIQADRKVGYYDFLGIKNRVEYFKLIGFDEKLARDREREISAILRKSGVSRANRSIFRFGALDAGYWQTRDVIKEQTKKRNAINFLNGDFEWDAEEHYGFLPNGLFVYFLSDKDGNRQDSAPDGVGPDKTSTSNDGRIHIFLSCVRCHKEGLRPINDYGRRLFAAPNGLNAYDYAKFERLERLYLRPLKKWIDKDVREFSDALVELNGRAWTTEENAKAYAAVWQTWAEDDITLEIAARELGGIPPAKLQDAVRHYALPVHKGGLGQLVPNTLLAFTLKDPLPMTREHFEENYALLQTIARGLLVKK